MPACSSPPRLASPRQWPDRGIGDAVKSREEMHLLGRHGLRLHLLRPDLGANAPPPPPQVTHPQRKTEMFGLDARSSYSSPLPAPLVWWWPHLVREDADLVL